VATTLHSLPSAPLRQRARHPTPAELQGVPWLRVLAEAEREQVVPELQVVNAQPGELVCKIGRPATFWFGVVDGLLKMSNDASAQAAITFSGLPPGAWFGEGTLLKRESYRYNIEALRKSLVAGLPIDAFEWLLERSIPFNRYLMNQLNERVSQFIALREIDRLTDPDSRVARSLGGLFHPVLFPGVGTLLRITQQELAYLVGLSRQRVNEALQALQAAGLIRVEYGGVTVLDLAALRAYRP
jgi:CRP-like cAMP-binding protein